MIIHPRLSIPLEETPEAKKLLPWEFSQEQGAGGGGLV